MIALSEGDKFYGWSPGKLYACKIKTSTTFGRINRIQSCYNESSTVCSFKPKIAKTQNKNGKPYPCSGNKETEETHSEWEHILDRVDEYFNAYIINVFK